jgi:hypothetical protein
MLKQPQEENTSSENNCLNNSNPIPTSITTSTHLFYDTLGRHTLGGCSIRIFNPYLLFYSHAKCPSHHNTLDETTTTNQQILPYGISSTLIRTHCAFKLVYNVSGIHKVHKENTP